MEDLNGNWCGTDFADYAAWLKKKMDRKVGATKQWNELTIVTDEVIRLERERCLAWVRSVLDGPGDHFTIDPVIGWLERGIESGKEPPKEEP